MIFILLSSQFPNRFLVSLLLDRFLNSQIVRILVKGALIIALLLWLNLFSGNRMSFEA